MAQCGLCAADIRGLVLSAQQLCAASAVPTPSRENTVL